MESQEQNYQPTIKEKVDALIEESAKKCITLSTKYGVNVTCENFVEKDVNGKDTGKVFTAYIKQPNFMVSIRAMDLVMAREFYAAGLALFPACVMDESSPEVHEDRYKVGLCGKLGFLMDVQAPEVKKS